MKSRKFFLFQNLIPVNSSFMLARAMLDDLHHLQVKTPILAYSSIWPILLNFLKIYFISFQCCVIFHSVIRPWFTHPLPRQTMLK